MNLSDTIYNDTNSAFKVRQLISDFGVILAIIVMTLVDFWKGVLTSKLGVPDEFQPTSSERGWVIPILGGNPSWTLLASIPPAFLFAILMFMDQHITAVIVNRREHRLIKGNGYHLDLFIVSILTIICSILGLPFFVAATVQSLNHVQSLQRLSKCNAPGERPKLLGTM